MSPVVTLFTALVKPAVPPRFETLKFRKPPFRKKKAFTGPAPVWNFGPNQPSSSRRLEVVAFVVVTPPVVDTPVNVTVRVGA